MLTLSWPDVLGHYVSQVDVILDIITMVAYVNTKSEHVELFFPCEFNKHHCCDPPSRKYPNVRNLGCNKKDLCPSYAPYVQGDGLVPAYIGSSSMHGKCVKPAYDASSVQHIGAFGILAIIAATSYNCNRLMAFLYFVDEEHGAGNLCKTFVDLTCRWQITTLFQEISRPEAGVSHLSVVFRIAYFCLHISAYCVWSVLMTPVCFYLVFVNMCDTSTTSNIGAKDKFVRYCIYVLNSIDCCTNPIAVRGFALSGVLDVRDKAADSLQSNDVEVQEQGTLSEFTQHSLKAMWFEDVPAFVLQALGTHYLRSSAVEFGLTVFSLILTAYRSLGESLRIYYTDIGEGQTSATVPHIFVNQIAV